MVLAARRPDQLDELCTELRGQGISCEGRAVDLTDATAVNQLIDALGSERQLPEMVLFNASAMHVCDVLEEDWEVIRGCFEVCVAGAFHVARRLMPTMLSENRGKLFFTGGGTALRGEPMMSSLSIGKAGMRNLVQALARRAEGSNVHVAQVTVRGRVHPEDPKFNPDAIAETYWGLYRQAPGEYTHEVMY
jgi:short-subunit dehydrogenase